MSAHWSKFDGQLTDAITFVCEAKEILDGEWREDETVRFTPKGRVEYPLTLKLQEISAPFGKYWDALYKKGDYSTLRDALQRYWGYAGTPRVLIDIVSGVSEDSETKEIVNVPLRTKLVTPGQQADTRLPRIVEGVQKQNLGVDRVVVGSHGDHVELQFLAKRLRQEVQKDDFVDCGLFVSLNGKVQVAAGLNRLVCTNGLTRTMNVWQRDEFDFDDSYFKHAQLLMNWFKSTTTQQVKHVRELSVVLDMFPKAFVSKFWKKWSEAVELEKLTWFDVVNDLTNAANSTLGDLRYKALAIGDSIQKYDGHCRTCSAEVETN
jgi:hypothetical protein